MCAEGRSRFLEDLLTHLIVVILSHYNRQLPMQAELARLSALTLSDDLSEPGDEVLLEVLVEVTQQLTHSFHLTDEQGVHRAASGERVQYFKVRFDLFRQSG